MFIIPPLLDHMVFANYYRIERSFQACTSIFYEGSIFLVHRGEKVLFIFPIDLVAT